MRVIVSIAAIAAWGSFVNAGPIDPPGGPITGTSASIQQIQDNLNTIKADADALLATLEGLALPTPIESLPSGPGADFVISEPGRYILTDNWFGDGANDAIKVEASNVVIDLNGFMIDGDIGGGGYAIDTIGGVNNIVVLNGTIHEYDDGIRLNGENNLVEDVRVYFMNGTAVNVGGNSTVRRTMCYLSAAGIQVGDSSAVLDCVSTNCGGAAITLGTGSIASNCATAYAQRGFFASQGAVIEGCTSSNNNMGYEVFGALVTGCAAYDNTSDGFVGTLSHFEGCHAEGNGDDGFLLNAGNHVVRCGATLNTSNGFHIVGVYNRVRSNHSAGNGSAQYRADLNATDSILTGNFAETTPGYAFSNASILMLGTIRTNFTNASIWDNFFQ